MEVINGPGIPMFVLDNASWSPESKTHDLLEQHAGSVIAGHGAFIKRSARKKYHIDDHKNLDGN